MGQSHLIASLTPDEQSVLAALALAGDAVVAPDELAALAGIDDVAAALAELRRRGLVASEEPRVAETWRRAAAADDRARRVLERAVTAAETGRLAPETLLGVTEWALRARRFREALAIVRAAQGALRVVRRVEAWVGLLQRALAAARALGDREAEAWAKDQLRVAKQIRSDRPHADPSSEWGPRVIRRLVQAAALAAAGTAGLAIGLVATGEPSTAAAPEVRTVLRSQPTTVTTGETVTTPGLTETQIVTQTETVTDTVTVTGTVTVTEPLTVTVPTTVTVTVAQPPSPIP
jgi:hypothetical protein